MLEKGLYISDKKSLTGTALSRTAMKGVDIRNTAIENAVQSWPWVLPFPDLV